MKLHMAVGDLAPQIITTETGCGPNCPAAIRPCPNDESEYARAMEPDLVKIFAIDLMPTATDEALCKMIPPQVP